MDIDKMVDEAVYYCLNDGLTEHDAADKALDDSDIDAIRQLAVAGLALQVGGQLNKIRARPPDFRGVADDVLAVSRSGRFQLPTRRDEGAAYFWLRKPYATADGRMAALLDFTLEDWEHNLSIAQARAAGWQARVDLFERGAIEMGSRPRAKTTSDLPKKALKALEQVAGEALGGAVLV